MTNYYITVPFSGYVELTIDTDIEPKASHGWDAATEFENVCVEAANAFLETLVEDKLESSAEIRGAVETWQATATHALVRGNGLVGIEHNELSAEECDSGTAVL